MSMPELNDCILDHIAIAVKNIPNAKKIYEDMGLVFSPKIEEVKDQKVFTAFAQIDKNAHIELLERKRMNLLRKVIDLFILNHVLELVDV
jgi:hypothetical protein